MDYQNSNKQINRRIYCVGKIYIYKIQYYLFSGYQNKLCFRTVLDTS